MTAKQRREYHRRWRRDHPENMARAQIKQREWAKKNPARVLANSRRHQQNNRAKRVQDSRRWQKKNPDKISVANRRRKALRRDRLHPLHDSQCELEMFRECQRLTKQTGVVHHLDHIIPMNRGGWHHHDNLQPLPSRLNVSKGDDPVWEHPLYKSWHDVPKYLWPEELKDTYEILSGI